MFQPRQNHLLASLLNLTGEEHLVENGVDLVKVENQVQLTHVPEELVEHFDEEMNRFEISQFVVVGVDADAEEETGVAAVDDLGAREVLADEGGGVARCVRGGRGEGCGAELDEVRLVFLVAGCYEAVDLESGGVRLC